MSKPRVILAVDRPGWAFHSIARQITHHLSDRCEFRMVLASEVKGECDILVCFWWNALPDLLRRVKYQRLVLCVYDHLSWCRTQNDRHAFQQALNLSDCIAVCNAKLAQDLTSGAFHVGDTPIVLVEDGVDTSLFRPLPHPDTFRIGWCGNSAVGYGQVKGLGMLSEACETAGVELSVLDFCNCGGLPQWQMSSWYKNISVYANASANDGTPNPPLEAMACGRPVISTRVGVMERLIQPGYNGYLVDRTVSDLVEAIRKIQGRDLSAMGDAARATAEHWDWTDKVKSWREVFHAASMPRKAPAIIKSKPRGLLVSDVPGWAFDINERDMAEYCTEFNFDRYHLIDKKPPPVMSKYDFVFLPHHRWGLDHYWYGVPFLGSLRSQWFDPNRPDTVPVDDAAFVRRCAGFHVCYLGAYSGLHQHFPQVVYLTNPVNMRRFGRVTEPKDRIICEWNGNAGHQDGDENADVKGINHLRHGGHGIRAGTDRHQCGQP